MSKHFDVLVLGGGSAGYVAARTAREFRERVAVVDGSNELGGLCILRGCMPSKTLIYSTEVLHLAKQGERFGLRIPEVAADMAAVQRRKRKWVGDFASYRREQLQSDRFTLFRQRGRFLSPHEIGLDDGTVVTADKVVVTTGSVVQVPPVPGLAETPAWTSDEVLELEEIPESVIVLGGGVVACELGQFLARVGSKVIQIQRSPHILKEAGPRAAEVVEQALRDDGVELWTDTEIQSIEKTASGVKVSFRTGGELVKREAAHLFNALGRKPATEGLGLEAAGVETADGMIACNGFQQSSHPDIYAAGDCAGPVELVHVAVRQGEIAARHACGGDPPAMNYDSMMVGIFTDPQVAWVGSRAGDAREKGIEVVEADYPFDDHGKALLMEAPRGYVKLVAERGTGRLLGAECVGKDATEMIHAMTVPVAAGLTVADCLKADWYHPTLAEIWAYPLEEIVEALEKE